MTFVMKTVASAAIDVAIQVPGEEQPSTITATWKLHSWSEFQARVKELQGGKLTDEQLVELDLIDLGGIKDEKGNDLPHSKELAAQLLELPYVRRPLLASWFDVQNGRSKAAAKN